MKVAFAFLRSAREVHKRLVLRAFKETLANLGKGVEIDPTVEILRPERVSIGDDCRLGRGSRIVAQSNEASFITLDASVRLRPYTHVLSYGGAIRLARRVTIGEGSVICGHGGLRVGENTMISWLCSIIPANHIFDRVDVPLRFQGEQRLGITIGSNVWVGSSVTIVDGVTIGDHAVIGAGSVVTRDIPPWSVAFGTPARVVRDRREPRPGGRIASPAADTSAGSLTDVDYYAD